MLLTAYALFITLMFGLQIAAIVLAILYQVIEEMNAKQGLGYHDYHCDA